MQQLTTIELNNSYCLIITYFLRKFYLLFKLIPTQRTVYFLLLDRSRVREYKFFQYSFQNSKLFLPLKKVSLFVVHFRGIFSKFSRRFRRIFSARSWKFRALMMCFSCPFSWYFQTSKWAARISKPFLDHPPNFREEIFKDSPSSFRDSIYKYDLTTRTKLHRRPMLCVLS